MGVLIGLTRQAEQLQGYQLETPADMVTALEYLAAGSYTGNITCMAGPTWQMWLQHSATNTSQSANLGDWIIIINNSIARVVPAADFTAQYNPA